MRKITFALTSASFHTVPTLCLLLIVALSSRSSYARDVPTAGVVDEPIFGLFYNPKIVHFGTIPTTRLLPACEKALSEYDPLPKAFVLYAKYETGSAHIYIIGAGDGLGIYDIHAGICNGGVPILSLLRRHHNPPEATDAPALSDSEIAGLFSDALNRYSRAFGGKEKFLQWLDMTTKYMLAGNDRQPPISWPQTYLSLLPAQRRQLALYRADR